MKNDEVLSIQSYLRKVFENDSINLRKKDSEGNILNFFVGEENFGEISKDIDPDELDISYSLNVPLKKSLKDTDSLENTLRNIFENSKIILSERGSIEDSKEVVISNTSLDLDDYEEETMWDGEDEFIGVVFEDDNDSCTFSMSILDFDL